jgi:hypothetical protein
MEKNDETDTPAKVGVQNLLKILDSGFHRNDTNSSRFDIGFLK